MGHDTYYDQISELYDACIQVDFDIPFFLSEAKRFGGDVLELMAGSGRISVPLIEAGVSLTCVDFSAGLLAILGRKLAERNLSAELHLMDVRDLSLHRTFDLIFIPFHSFTEVTDLDDERRVLEHVAGHLSDQGRFICTLHNPAVRLKTVDRPYSLWLDRRLPGDQGTVMLWGSQRYDEQSQLVTVLEFFEAYDSANVMKARHRVELRFRLLTSAQFESMAEEAGLEVEALYGDYDLAAFDEHSSPFMIWMLRKKR